MKYNKAPFYKIRLEYSFNNAVFNHDIVQSGKERSHLAKLSNITFLHYHVSIRHGQLKKQSSLHMRLECEVPLSKYLFQIRGKL